MNKKMDESLAGVHTHTHTSSLLVKNNRIDKDRKIVIKTYGK